MAIERLTTLVARQGADEAEAVLAAAHAEAARIAAESAARLAARREAQRAARAAALAAAHARSRVAARRAARAAVADARQRALARIFAAARPMLADAARTPDGIARVDALVRAALPYAPDGPLTVHVAAASEAQVRRTVAELGRAVRFVVDPDVCAGARIASDDGRTVIDATLDRQLEARRSALAIALARQLAPEEPAHVE
jgi:vacuolar-type H+-ATPase subunit E/Vma4